MRRFFRLLTCLTALSSALGAAPRTAAVLQNGQIDGAFYVIASPSERPWNGNLLLLAHGYRPESAPLVADLNPNQSAYQLLLSEGWIIAKTSYRRNGTIIHDAIADLHNLHAEVVDRFGQANRAIVMGDSMGATISTLLDVTDESIFDEFSPRVSGIN